MMRLLLTLLLVSITVSQVTAQRKSELIAEIDNLKSELDSVKTELFTAKKIEKASVVKAEALEAQVNELQDANATLLTNLNNFAKVSNKNSDIANSAMASLQAKEGQLKAMKDAIAKNDSTAIVVLTNAKQTLGENAKIAVSNGAVVISSTLASLFGTDMDSTLTEEGKAWMEKIAAILNVNPNVALTVEGLSMTGDLDLPGKQAATIASVLQKDFAIAPERITSLGRDGNLKEGISLKLHPSYQAFYLMVKENMKNGQ
ncbi:hypothetical protein [Ulvibacterium sp.]|uniref:hypothetical protein n=1 Tax=Ulvibacterium sp. TaxID=2665914 RepID=UPI003BA843A0